MTKLIPMKIFWSEDPDFIDQMIPILVKEDNKFNLEFEFADKTTESAKLHLVHSRNPRFRFTNSRPKDTILIDDQAIGGHVVNLFIEHGLATEQIGTEEDMFGLQDYPIVKLDLENLKKIARYEER